MKKILIITSNRLGDCILSSGLNKYFKQKYSNCHLTFVCGTLPSELFKYCNFIDKLIVLNKKKYSLHWIYLWYKVFFTKWFYVIDLRGTGLSFFLLSKKRTIYRKSLNSEEHKVSELTRKVTGKILSPSFKIVDKINSRTEYLKEILKAKKNKKIIIVAPTANWIGKIWPIERYLELTNSLRKKKIFCNSIFIFVGPSEEKLGSEILLKKKRKYIYDLFGKLSVIEIFKIMEIADFFIGNDSGLMHMAALAKTKTIGLFGPSNSKKYGPWGKGNLVVSSPKTPDQLMGFKGFNPKKCGSLMLDLKTDEVLKKILNYSRNNE